MLDVQWVLGSIDAGCFPATIDREILKTSLLSEDAQLVFLPTPYLAARFAEMFSSRVRRSSSANIAFHGADELLAQLGYLPEQATVCVAVSATDHFLYYAVANEEGSLIGSAVVVRKRPEHHNLLLDTGELVRLLLPSDVPEFDNELNDTGQLKGAILLK